MKLKVKCSLPGCCNNVGYHQRKGNTQTGFRNMWKTMCEKHRGSQKHIVDNWKLNRGCENSDGRYGFTCTTGAILDPGILQVNHKDGNNINRDDSNIEVLCGHCHHIAGKQEKHHLNQYARFPKFGNPGLFSGLFDIEEIDN